MHRKIQSTIRSMLHLCLLQNTLGRHTVCVLDYHLSYSNHIDRFTSDLCFSEKYLSKSVDLLQKFIEKSTFLIVQY